eukprot:scaffold10839_cov112-Isochrysis_galbana.AAC.2
MEYAGTPAGATWGGHTAAHRRRRVQCRTDTIKEGAASWRTVRQHTVEVSYCKRPRRSALAFSPPLFDRAISCAARLLSARQGRTRSPVAPVSLYLRLLAKAAVLRCHVP